jgi:hypothetical protein
MSAAPLQEQSLLVKSQPGLPVPYALEDLRTGRREQFGVLADLLAVLSKALETIPPTTTRE